MASKVRITLKRSPIGRLPRHRATLRALGLRKFGQSVEYVETPVLRGMIDQISYLLTVVRED